MKKTLLILLVTMTFSGFGQNLVRQFSFNRNGMDVDSVNNIATLSGAVVADARAGVGNQVDDASLYFAPTNNTVKDVNPINNSNWTGAAYSLWVRGVVDGQIVQFPFGGYGIRANVNGYIQGNMDGSSSNPAQSTFSLNDGLWHHIVLQNSGTVTKLFIDKRLDTSIADPLFTPTSMNQAAELHFGRDRFFNNRLTGEIDEFRMFDDTLSQAQIDSLYDLAKPESNRYLELDYKFNDDFADSSLNRNNLTHRTGGRHSFTAGRSNMGSDSSVSMNSAHMRTIRTIYNDLWKSMTISFWANNPSSGRVAQGYNLGYGVDFGQLGDAKFFANGSSNGALVATSNNYLNDGLWHHVVAVNSGDTSYLYIDGVLDNKQAETYFSQGTLNSATQFMYFGTGLYLSGGNEVFTNTMSSGEIDDFRLYSKGLNQNEISNLYQFGIATGEKELPHLEVEKFSVYPNPANDFINLPEEVSLAEEIKVFNVKGQVVMETTATKKLSITNLESGIYFLFVNKENQVYRSKFIKE